MTESTFTFRLNEELKAAFIETAKAEDRTAAQLLRTLMRDAVRRRHEAQAHDTWFRTEVEQAMREADDPQVRRIPEDEARSGWRRRRVELESRAGDKPRED